MTYHIDNGIPVVEFDAASAAPWAWTCPVCGHTGNAADESTARHAWFDHVGIHDLVATWPDTADIDVPAQFGDTRIPAAEQSAMSERPSSRPPAA